MKKYLITILILTGIPAVSANSSSRSNIDWAKGKIIAWGESKAIYTPEGYPVGLLDNKPVSINKARMDQYVRSRDNAMRNAIETLKNVKLNYNKSIFDIIKNNDAFKVSISRLFDKRTQISDSPENLTESRCRIEIKTGDIIKALGITFPVDNFPEVTENHVKTEYTSLIIDTRGLSVDPMLLPVIYNEYGLEIYGKNFVLPDFAINRNMVTYVNTQNEALNNEKTGKRPYFCTALDALNGSPVISNEDIKKFYNHKTNLNNLRKCRVIFIINRHS